MRADRKSSFRAKVEESRHATLKIATASLDDVRDEVRQNCRAATPRRRSVKWRPGMVALQKLAGVA